MQDYRIEAWRHGSEILASLSGRLTQQACAEVKLKLNELLTPAIQNFYVSLADLEFIDSSGLGTLIGLKMEANRTHSSMTLLRPAARIMDILRVSRLDSIFEIMEGLEAEVLTQNIRKIGTPVFTSTGATPVPPTGGGENPAPAGDGRSQQLCNDAVEYLRQGNLAQAMNAYQRARQIDPENIAILNNLGVICEKKAEWYEQGREIWTAVLELSRRNNDDKHIARAQRHLEMLEKLIRVN
ncbi:MAG: STAS domain-containing protein [Candidatus Sumerlaeia bacterium]